MSGMKVRLMGRRQALVGAVGTMLATPAFAQQRVKSGTVNIEQVQVAFIGSGNVGSGTLHFHGKSYRFSVGGLGVGGFGVSKMEAWGDVYNLKELRDFPGPYGQARYGAAAGDKGSGEMWLENPNGVMINLKTRRQGLAVSLGADCCFSSSSRLASASPQQPPPAGAAGQCRQYGNLATCTPLGSGP